MTDAQIIELYCLRSEHAISETAAQYGGLLYHISYNILHSHEDTEECVNDTYLKAWERIPPAKPNYLSVYLGRITRRISIDKWRYSSALKRGGNQLTLAVEELDRTLSTGETPEDGYLRKELTQTINAFLRGLPRDERNVFICRYWYLNSIAEISSSFGFSQSKVKSMLMRTRNKLKEHFEKEGVFSA